MISLENRFQYLKIPKCKLKTSSWERFLVLIIVLD